MAQGHTAFPFWLLAAPVSRRRKLRVAHEQSGHDDGVGSLRVTVSLQFFESEFEKLRGVLQATPTESLPLTLAARDFSMARGEHWLNHGVRLVGLVFCVELVVPNVLATLSPQEQEHTLWWCELCRKDVRDSLTYLRCGQSISLLHSPRQPIFDRAHTALTQNTFFNHLAGWQVESLGNVTTVAGAKLSEEFHTLCGGALCLPTLALVVDWPWALQLLLAGLSWQSCHSYHMLETVDTKFSTCQLGGDARLCESTISGSLL